MKITIPSPTPSLTVRNIVEAVKYLPPKGETETTLAITRWDLLTKGMMNALRLTLEEPPPHLRVIDDATGVKVNLSRLRREWRKHHPDQPAFDCRCHR